MSVFAYDSSMDTTPNADQPTPSESLAGQMVSNARQAQPDWEALPLANRLEIANRVRGLLAQRATDLCQMASKELGKSGQDTLSADILPLAEACKYLKRHAKRILATRRISRADTPWVLFGSKTTVERRARGVVGIIGTWNYPYFLAGTQMIQALVAGNTVVFKPSEMAPGCAKLLVEIFQMAGLPSGVLHALPPEREFGTQLTSAPLNHLVFTGSLPVGRMVANSAAFQLVSSTLELSGCDPLLALDDADPALVASSAWFGAVVNQGQTCVATRRVIATNGLLSRIEFELARFLEGVPPFRLVQPREGLKAYQLALEAVGQGARFIGPVPSLPSAETGCPPLLLANANPEMRICRESLFAPVLCLVPAKSEQDMLKVEKACPLSLGASVFSAVPGRALALANRLRSPNISINEVVISTGHPATPIVAKGLSGWGSTQGDEGLLELTEPRVIYQGPNKATAFRPHLGLVPKGRQLTPDMAPLLATMLGAKHHASFWQRWSATCAFPFQAIRWMRAQK